MSISVIWNATIVLFLFFLPLITSLFNPFSFFSSTALSLPFFPICMLVPAFLSGYSLQDVHFRCPM